VGNKLPTLLDYTPQAKSQAISFSSLKMNFNPSAKFAARANALKTHRFPTLTVRLLKNSSSFM